MKNVTSYHNPNKDGSRKIKGNYTEAIFYIQEPKGNFINNYLPGDTEISQYLNFSINFIDPFPHAFLQVVSS